MPTPPRRERPAPGPGAAPFPPPVPGRVGLVCAGGGVTGAMYQIGVLAALEERMEGASLCALDVVVGVSAGSWVGSLVANGVSPAELYGTVTGPGSAAHDIDDLDLFRLNLGEMAQRLATAPLTLLDALRDFYENRHETTLTDLVQVLGHLLPSGVFSTDGLGRWVSTFLSEPGRTDDFRKLPRRLLVVAVELDTGETFTFGAAGTDEVPISRAVQASCAIPGLYRPVRIGGVDYVDGGVRKTAHISLALEERCGLVVCVNPIVPVRYRSPRQLPSLGVRQRGPVAARGLPAILDQVFRVTLHSRMQYGLARYRRDCPGCDLVVLEPRAEDLPRFMTRNIMRTSGRSRIAEFAWRSTMAAVDADFPRLSRVFARHGVALSPPVPRAAASEAPRAARLLVQESSPPRAEARRSVLRLVR